LLVTITHAQTAAAQFSQA